jgi:diguanylate cyclase (GGDEF)-like protein/PAS domain S-box-containing protein
LHTFDFIIAAAGALFAHVMVRLWRNRATAGAIPCLLLFVAITVYLVTLVIAETPVAVMHAGYLASALMAPLLFVTTLAYIGLSHTGWRTVSWLSVATVGALAVINIAADTTGTFAAMASAGDALSRSEIIKDARPTILATTMWSSYVFVLGTIALALYSLVTDAQKRQEILFLLLVTFLVLGADVSHYAFGFTISGSTPTPYALVAGVFIAISGLFRSSMLDVRPMARSVLIDSIKDGMLAVDQQRRIIDCNQAAAELLERRREALLGGAATELLPREISALLQCSVHLRSELAACVNGTQRWFEVDATPLQLRGKHAGVVIVIRDISERHQARIALAESRRALESANARLVEQSVTDPLTGLKNRRFLFQRLNEEMNRSQRSGDTLGLLLVDIDHFKRVNDTHGHPVGDQALIEVAATLARTVRDCDVVARLGGEEFAVLAVNAEAAGLVGLAERIRQAISRVPIARNTNQPMILTVSIGVGFAGPSSNTAEALFAETDRYLYQAKNQGRNRVIAGPSDLQETG